MLGVWQLWKLNNSGRFLCKKKILNIIYITWNINLQIDKILNIHPQYINDKYIDLSETTYTC